MNIGSPAMSLLDIYIVIRYTVGRNREVTVIENVASETPPCGEQTRGTEELLMLDATGNLEGILIRSDILGAFEKGSDGKMTCWRRGHATYPDELLHDAAARCSGAT